MGLKTVTLFLLQPRWTRKKQPTGGAQRMGIRVCPLVPKAAGAAVLAMVGGWLFPMTAGQV